MQAESNQINRPKETVHKEFYKDSVLKYNMMSELCHDISNTESLDINVEKFLVEIADNYVNSVFDTACQIAKHKFKYKNSEGNPTVSAGDLSIAMGK